MQLSWSGEVRHQSISKPNYLICSQARDSIWINPGFQEQLVLFQLCQYKPHPGDGVYASWKTKVDRKLRASGLR